MIVKLKADFLMINFLQEDDDKIDFSIVVTTSTMGMHDASILSV